LEADEQPSNKHQRQSGNQGREGYVFRGASFFVGFYRHGFSPNIKLINFI
jgi:hypothetical protein